MNTVLLDGIGRDNEVGEQVTSLGHPPEFPCSQVRHTGKTGEKEYEEKEWVVGFRGDIQLTLNNKI